MVMITNYVESKLKKLKQEQIVKSQIKILRPQKMQQPNWDPKLDII